MSYTPTEWHTGDIVTANKLNNLEQGVVDAQLPEYSASDSGKVLTLGEGSGSETAVLVPEQTVVITVDTDLVPLTGVDLSPVTAGDILPLTVNDNSVNLTALADQLGNIALIGTTTDLGTQYVISYVTDGYYIGITNPKTTIPIPGTYTVSLTASVPSVEPKWEDVSGVPPYTYVDIGKVLIVEEGTETGVVVPEQTVTVTQGVQFYYANLSDALINWDNAQASDSINLTVNGTTYTANYDANSFGAPAFIALNEDTPVAAVAHTGSGVNTATFLTLAAGNYTVSATGLVPKVEPKWGAAGGGSYIIHLNADPPNFSTVEHYDDIVSALQTQPAFLKIDDTIPYYLPLLYNNDELSATMVAYEALSTKIGVVITKFTINDDDSVDIASYNALMDIQS